MAPEPKSSEQSLKQMELELKMQKKVDRKRKKDDKTRLKLEKKKAKMLKQYEKEGRQLPTSLSEMDIKPKGDKKTPDAKIAEAEVVEFKSQEWKRRSVHSIDDIENKIDRFSGKGVKGLEDRYREKYGEDLKVPELYQIETKLELDQTIDRLATDDEEEDDTWGQKKEAEKKEEKSSFFSRSKKESTIDVAGPEIEKEVRFFDLSSALFYLYRKWGKSGGGGKKAITIIVDILLIPTWIIRIITTPIYVMKRRKARKAAIQEASVA